MQTRPTLLSLVWIFVFAAVTACSTAPTPDVEPESEPATAPGDEKATESEDAGESNPSSGDEESVSLVDSQVLPVGDSPVYGDPDAPMTIVLYPADDYGPLPMLKQIVDANDGEVRLVAKHLDVSFEMPEGTDPRELRRADSGNHSKARMALVLEALRRQDPEVYWPAARLLVAGRPDFEERPPEDVGARVAEEYGLDVEQYRDDLEAPETVEAVRRDTEMARNLGITGRNTVVFNGEKIGGMYLDLHPAIDLVERHLDTLDQLREEGVEKQRLYEAAVDRHILDDGTIPEIERTVLKRTEWSLPEIRRIEFGEDDPVRGPDDAPVTIVKILDLEDCIRCAIQTSAFEPNMEEYRDEIRTVFKYSPRALDEEYETASRTLAAAHRQGRFWDTYEALMENERHRDPTERVSPDELAARLGLDTERFETDLDADETTEMIEDSIEDVRSAESRVTPALIVNGIEMLDPDIRQLQAVVERQLEIAGRLGDQRGLTGEELHEALVEYNEEHTGEVWLGDAEK